MTSTLIFGFSSVLFIALAVPLQLRKVPPNRLYGFRTPATLAVRELWYAVNASAGRDLLVVGIGLLAVTAALHFLAIPETVGAVTWQ